MARNTLGIKTDSLSGHSDLMIIQKEDRASIGIEKIRNLITWLSLKPFQSKIKITLIQDAQNLTLESQNALLKTLEEPPGHCQIILTAPHRSSLIPTVVSRCALIDLGLDKTETTTAELNLKRLKVSDLIKMDIGKRLDYGEENKEVFADKEQTLAVIDGWLGDLAKLLAMDHPDNTQDIYQFSQSLFALKKDLVLTNVNPRNLVDLFFLQIQYNPSG